MSKLAVIGLFAALSFAATPVMAHEEYVEHEHVHEDHHDGDALNHALHDAGIPHVHVEEHGHEHGRVHIEGHHHHDDD